MTVEATHRNEGNDKRQVSKDLHNESFERLKDTPSAGPLGPVGPRLLASFMAPKQPTTGSFKEFLL